ncbi:aldehyde ferredoxin oxidoreductase family protein [Desulfosporosinus burensis]
MKDICGYAGTVLMVDLTSGEIEKLPLDMELARNYVGGRGLNMKSLYDLVGPETDPLGPENIVIFGVGPVNGTNCYLGSRWNVSGKSPHTGILGDSNAGGHFGTELKYAGYDQIIIKGKAERPVYLYIHDDQVEIKDAADVWGKDTWEAQEIIRQELKDKLIQIAACGPAAENGVTFSGVFCNLVRAAGRTGMGSIMGSKNLKAVALRGTGSIKVADAEKYFKWNKTILERMLNHPDFGSRSIMGTPRNVNPLNEGGYLVTKHFETGHFPEAHKISGEVLAQDYNKKNKSCHACPLHCSRWFVVPKGKDFEGLKGEGPEYEAMAGFGSRILNSNMAAVLKCNDLCNRLGMDAISTSETIAWTMECLERGIISKEEVGLDLDWGKMDEVIKLIEMISYREGWGDVLAEGVRKAAERIGRGSEKYAMHVKGLEMIQAEPRGMKGYAVCFATATRGGDHLRGEPFFEMSNDVEEGARRYGIPETALRLEEKGKGLLLQDFQDWCALSDMMNVCKNNMVCMELLSMDEIAEFLESVTGFNYTPEEIRDCARRLMAIEQAFNNRLGLTRKDDILPKRFVTEPLPESSGPSAGSVVHLEPMLDEFYKARRYDPETAMPTKELLFELGLEDVYRDLQKFC